MRFTVMYEGERLGMESNKMGLTIEDVLDEMELSSEIFVLKRNGNIVIKESLVEEGDDLEFIQIIYGG